MQRVIILLLIAGFCGEVSAQNDPDTIDSRRLSGRDINTVQSAVPFLTIAPDARSGGMGEVGVASEPDAYSVHWNPAKLAFVKEPMGFSMSFTPWLRALGIPDINLSYISGFYRLDDMQTIGSSFRYFSMGNITFTDIQGSRIGEHNPSELAYDVAYSRRLSDNFSLGMAMRFIYSNLANGNFDGRDLKPAVSGAADVSGYYTKEINLGGQDGDVALGFNISNIGSKVSYTTTSDRDPIPTNLRLGGRGNVHLDEFNELAFMVDLSKLLVPTQPIYEEHPDGSVTIKKGMDPERSVPNALFTSFYDAPGGTQEEFREINWSTGLEYWYDNQFAVRGGYFYEHETKGNRQFFTLGAALKYSAFELDFAYLVPTSQRHPLENTLRFSLAFGFGEG